MERIKLVGKIDELENVNTPNKVIEYCLGIGELSGPSFAASMFRILGLSGRYTVEGIEGFGLYYHGPNMPEGIVFDIIMLPKFTLFDVMSMAWALTEHTAWPDVFHVWFESVTIDTNLRIIRFSMGS